MGQPEEYVVNKGNIFSFPELNTAVNKKRPISAFI
jgi:hypothetical protein